MRRLRQWFSRPAPRPVRARLLLEALEERAVPSASTFIDGAGAHTDFLVDTGGNLIQQTQAGPQQLSGGVLSAHAFRDPSGHQGLDIIYNDNQYWVFDSTGAHPVAAGVLSASTSYTASGELVRDVVYTNGAAYRTTPLGTQFLTSGVLFVSNYQDPMGNVGLDIVLTTNQAFEADSFGGRFLGANISTVEHFDNTVVSQGQVVAVGEQVLNVVDTSGTFTQYSTVTGARAWQSGIA